MKKDIPIRENIKHIGSDGNKIKLGWVVHEIPPGQSEEDYFKDILSDEDFKKWKYINSPGRLSETDEADFYRDGYGGGLGRIFKTGKNFCYGNRNVLEDLWGQP